MVELLLAEYENKSITDILAPLRTQQRDFMLLSLVGMNKEDIVDVIHRDRRTIEQWINNNDNGFKGIEAYLTANREKYLESAAKEYAKIIRAKAIIGLARLADKAFDWDSVKPGDKAYVFGALKVLKDIGLGSEGGGGSYEELIMKRHIAT